MKLGERLKRLREHEGLTQKQIAQKIGVATSTYQNYERNEREATESFLTRVVSNFRVSERWLLSGVEPMFAQQEFSEEEMKEAKEMMNGIATRLKQAREALGLTQGKLADSIGGVPVTTISKYEVGLIKPSSEMLAKLADMGLNINWLLSGVGPMFARDKQEFSNEEETNEMMKEMKEMNVIDTFVPALVVGEADGEILFINRRGRFFKQSHVVEEDFYRIDKVDRAEAFLWCEEKRLSPSDYLPLFGILEC